MTLLYHYTSGQGLFGILNSSELHCSNIKHLNDPSEKSYFNTVLTSVIENSTDCNAIYNALYNESMQLSLIGSKDLFIASFSKNYDSLSMWNYYAKGNGYNIGLDIDKIIRKHETFDDDVVKIEMIYDIDEQFSKLKKYIENYKEKYLMYFYKKGQISKLKKNSFDFVDMCEEFNSGIYKLQLSFKHPAYKNEEEVRIIISDLELKSKFTKYKVSENGVFIEYTILKLKLKSDLKSITTHPLNGNLHIDGTKRFLASRIGENTIKIKPSLIPYRIV